MLTLNDGRSELWQWDTKRKLTVDADCSQVHFSNKVFGRSNDVDVIDGIAIIPDILLQTDKDLTAWAFVGTAENGYTKISKTFKVNKRNKPADYVFTPPEQTSLEEIKEKIEYLESIQDPDAIKNAVEDYLEQNPVDAPVQSVNGKTGKVLLTALDVGAISQDDLQEATNKALAQAKESGVFDGPKGDDYVLTTADKEEIAEMAADLVEVPDSGGNVELDTTLTQSGKAADAKAVGDKIAEITGISLIEPAEDDIPKFFYGGALPQTKDDAVMSIRYISKTQDVSGYCETKAQGNSSMSFPKKNQTTKFYKDKDCTEKLKVDFKGWGKQSKFCFKANWIDLTQARNVVSARLWGDVVKSRANYAELPELLRTSPNQGAVDGFPVKVYADGIYQGRYTINIPKDAWMANMDKDLDTHCILCGENYVSGCFRASANINESDWTDEIHDTVPASIKTRWNQVISFVMNSTDDEFRANLNQYFYIDSLIDYYLFGLASCGLDAFGKNQLYMTYDGQKWIATMYDMDSTWGLWWNGSSIVATDYDRSEYQDFKDGEGNLLYIRLENLFYEELKARWAELRSGALSIENIINRFERFTDIASAELVKEDYASTTADGKFTGIPSKTTSTIQQIRGYAVARHAWCDTYVAALTGGEVEPDEPDVPDEPETVPCTGISLDKTELTFDGEGTQIITATVTPSDTTDSVVWVSSAPTVVSISVEGNVCTVQSVANGEAVITVTCGDYNASCSITVSGIKTVNLLENVLIDKESYLNASTGVTGSSQDAFVTEPVNVSSFQGVTIMYCVKGTPSKSSTRIVFYDSNMNFISGHYDSKNAVDILKVAVPDNAMYARFGGTQADLSEISLDVPTSESIDSSSGEPGYIYNSIDGSKVQDSSHNCFKIPIVPGSRYYTNKFVSGAYYGENDNFVEALPWVSSSGYRGIFSVPAGVYYIGVNVGNNSVSSFEFYVNLRRIGYRTFSE